MLHSLRIARRITSKLSVPKIPSIRTLTRYSLFPKVFIWQTITSKRVIRFQPICKLSTSVDGKYSSLSSVKSMQYNMNAFTNYSNDLLKMSKLVEELKQLEGTFINGKYDTEIITKCFSIFSNCYPHYSKDYVKLISDLWMLYLKNLRFSEEISTKFDWVYSGTWGLKENRRKMSAQLYNTLAKYTFETTNYYPAISFVRRMIDAHLTKDNPYSETIKMINETMNDYRRSEMFWKDRVLKSRDSVNADKALFDRLNTQEKFDAYVMGINEFDFSPMNCKDSIHLLESMYTAIKSIPEAPYWFKKDGKCVSSHSVVRKLSAHKAVDDCGHSGTSMHWTIAQFRTIYQEGWNKWVKGALLARGMGWDYVTKKEAEEFGLSGYTEYISGKTN